LIENKILSMISLAAKAGRIQSGSFLVEKAVKDKKALLVILAMDASGNTTKMFTNMCKYYEVPLYKFANKDELGHRIGKGERSAVAILDRGFSEKIQSLLETGGIQYVKCENS